MSRSLKEIPFAIEDIVAPGSEDRAEEIYSDSVIPIYSFTGSPIKEKVGSFRYTNSKHSDNVPADEIAELAAGEKDFEDLESYFSKMKMVDADGKAEDGEEDDGDYNDEDLLGEDYEDNAAPAELDDPTDYFDDDFERYLDAPKEVGKEVKASAVEAEEQEVEQEQEEEEDNEYANEEDNFDLLEEPILSVGTLQNGMQLTSEAIEEIQEEIDSWKQYQQTLLQESQEEEGSYQDIIEDLGGNDSATFLELANEAAIESFEILSKTDPNIMQILRNSDEGILLKSLNINNSNSSSSGINNNSIANGLGSTATASDVVNGIMDEYNALIASLRSPRPASKRMATLNSGTHSNTKPKFQQYPIDYENDDDDENDLASQILAMKHSQQQLRQQQELLLQQQPKQQQQRASLPLKKIKPVSVAKKVDPVQLYQRNQRDQERQKGKSKSNNNPNSNAIGGNSNSNNNANKVDAAEKHKQWLQAVQEKRRKEEAALIEEAQRAIEKRKRFKEALLEKALRAKESQEQQQQQFPDAAEDTVPAAPKAAVTTGAVSSKTNNNNNNNNNKVVPSNKPAPSVLITETGAEYITASDKLKAEEEKKEQIANIRRKFKEQHKKTLLALMEKNRAAKQQQEEGIKQELLQKEKRKLKAYQLAAKRENKAGEDDNDDEEGTREDEHNSSYDRDDFCDFVVDSEGIEGTRNTIISDENRIPLSEQNTVIVNPAVSKARAARKQEQYYDKEPVVVGNSVVAVDDTAITDFNATVAGSALAAVRSRSHGNSRNNNANNKSNRNNALLSPRHSDAEDSPDLDAPLKADKGKLIAKHKDKDSTTAAAAAVAPPKKQPSSLANANQKMSAYLEQLAQEKKAAEMEAKKKAERAKRRAQLLSERIRMEALERKLMNAEDDNLRFKVGVVCANNNKATSTKKVTAEAVESMISRLAAKAQSSSASADAAGTGYTTVPARDYADWKRKNGVPSDGMVFCMTGWYPCVKQALLDRGWHFNPDPTSSFFDMKWTLRSIDVDSDTLQPWQLTNHFLKNVAITTKVGLLKSLQSVIWLADVSMNEIIPRGYDLSNPMEMQAFIDDFRIQKASCILKKLYSNWTNHEAPLLRQVTSEAFEEEFEEYISPELRMNFVQNNSSSSSNSNSNKSDSLASINVAVFEACCTILERQLQPFDDNYIDEQDGSSSAFAMYNNPNSNSNNHNANRRANNLPNNSSNGPISTNTNATNTIDVSGTEWELISNYNIHESGSLPSEPVDLIDAFLHINDDNSGTLSGQPQGYAGTKLIAKEKKRKEQLDKQERDWAIANINKLRKPTAKDLQRVYNILIKMGKIERHQSFLNGAGTQAKNIWIVKPAAKSRGRGIATFSDLPKLLKYIDAGTGLSSQWIVQKYMENPLLIAKRKFDMRQWVLVTDWNPLTIYFFDEFYVRFSVEEYAIDDSALENVYVHLVNNSIGKNSENFNKIVAAENGESIEGYMWSFASFIEYLNFTQANKQKKQSSTSSATVAAAVATTAAAVGSEAVATSEATPTENEDTTDKVGTNKEGTNEDDTNEDGSNESGTNESGTNEDGTNEEEDKRNNIDISNDKEGNSSNNTTTTDRNNSNISNIEPDKEKQQRKESIDSMTGEQIVRQKIQTRMKEIAKYALMCASEMIEHRKNSWELYGFDYMVDDQYNAWLIEINSSPACDYSTKVTERYVQKALVELLSVVLDTRAYEQLSKKERAEKARPDTGGWECIYKGSLLETPTASFGVDMTLKGEAIKQKRPPQPQPTTINPQFGNIIYDSKERGDQSSLANNATLPKPPNALRSSFVGNPNSISIKGKSGISGSKAYAIAGANSTKQMRQTNLEENSCDDSVGSMPETLSQQPSLSATDDADADEALDNEDGEGDTAAAGVGFNDSDEEDGDFDPSDGSRSGRTNHTKTTTKSISKHTKTIKSSPKASNKAATSAAVPVPVPAATAAMTATTGATGKAAKSVAAAAVPIKLFSVEF